MPKTVLITGGYGYVGSWITKELLQKGYTVRLAVRNKNKTAAFEHLVQLAENAPGTLEIWEADLVTMGSFDTAAKGADALIHTAAAFTMTPRDIQKDLIEPSLLGARNALSAANKSGTIKKVVLTSSGAAVYGDNIDMKNLGIEAFDESHFNESSTVEHQPYSYAKTLAEKEAWKMREAQSGWKLAVINPTFVMGPPLAPSPNSESILFMQSFLSGKYLFGGSDLWFGYTDVRDVAHAHILAMENEPLEGRFIISNTSMNILDFAKIIKKYCRRPYLLPFMSAPKFLVYPVGWAFNLTLKFIRLNIGYPLYFNNRKSREVLGLEYTPIDTTVKDMVEYLEKNI